MGVRAILDQPQTATPAQFGERIEIGGSTSDVHGDDRLGPWCDRCFGGDRVDAQCVWIDVDEDRCGVDSQGGGRGCDERHPRDDHLVALADVARCQRCLECVSPVGQCEPVASAVVLREFVGERPSGVAVSLPPPTGIENCEQALSFPVVPDRPRGVVLAAHGLTSE